MTEQQPRFNSILLVDDEKFILRILADTVGPLATHLLQATNGREALKQLATEKPDMIISDIMMPEMNGLELLQAIRLDPRLNEIPFILLTVKDTTQDFLDGYASGADYYLPKPFDYPQLIRAIETALEVRKERTDQSRASG